MKPDALARSYVEKAAVRLEILGVFLEKGGYSDVVREAQELVELLLKGVLRGVGAEVPKVHDVGRHLRAQESRLPEAVRPGLDRVVDISKRLRKERELSFSGAEDFIPTTEYELGDAEAAIADAREVLDWVEKVFAAS